jgi:hypothetical protein
MGVVEEEAGKEAEKKGLHSAARRAYIGGAFNRIIEAHKGKAAEAKAKHETHTEKLSASNQEVVRRHKAHDAKLAAARQADREIEQRTAKPVTSSSKPLSREKLLAERDRRVAERLKAKEVSTTESQYQAYQDKKEAARKAEYERFLAQKAASAKEAEAHLAQQNELSAQRKAREDKAEADRLATIQRRREQDDQASKAIAAERARLEYERTRPLTEHEEKVKKEIENMTAVKRDEQRTKELARAKAYRQKHNISLTTGKKRKP